MKLCQRRAFLRTPLAALLVLFCWASVSHAYVLIADRPQKRILKYSDSGTLLNVVVQEPLIFTGPTVNTSGPNSIALSPDGTKLYVSVLNNSVVRYDFNGTLASNPQVYTSNGASSIIDPGGVVVSPNNATVYVSNRGGGFLDSVAQLTPNGVSQAADLHGGGITGRTGLAFTTSGVLLAGTFGTDFMGGGPGGGVVRLNAGAFTTLVPDSQSTSGVASLMVVGNDLYLTASVGPDFQGRIAKFNASTGAAIAGFGVGGLVTPQLSFPSGLTPAADGTGFLVSMLTFTTTGAGRVDRYLFDGTRVGVWANNSTANPALGFVEATSLLYVPVPEPASIAGMGVLAIAGIAARRRTGARQR
jgi:DNA-binding beta-propeller fold protein YncE